MIVSREVARELDVLQAKARYSSKVNGIEPEFTIDTSLQLKAARHPMLEHAVPVDVLLDPPNRVLLITGPNTGGKTVALKTAGLFALMAQAGLHLPATVAKLPVFRSVFADIGDEQSIEASLSTFSSHIRNLVSMDRDLQMPALVLLDEVGTGTDPNEGGALATAIVQHFRQRGALIDRDDAFRCGEDVGHRHRRRRGGGVRLRSAELRADLQAALRRARAAASRSRWRSASACPPSVITAARGYLSDDQKRLQAHLSRLDAQARALESDRVKLERERRAFNETNAELSKREKSLAEREEVFKKRLNERLDERLRQARRDVDAVIEQLKEKSEAIAEKASLRAADQHRRDRIGARRSASGDRSHRRGSAASRSASAAAACKGRALSKRRSRKSDRASPSADWDSRASSSRSTATARRSTCAESAFTPRSRSCVSSVVRLRRRRPRKFASTSN